MINDRRDAQRSIIPYVLYTPKSRTEFCVLWVGRYIQILIKFEQCLFITMLQGLLKMELQLDCLNAEENKGKHST